MDSLIPCLPSERTQGPESRQLQAVSVNVLKLRQLPLAKISRPLHGEEDSMIVRLIGLNSSLHNLVARVVCSVVFPSSGESVPYSRNHSAKLELTGR